MKQLYYIRHGLSEANKLGVFSGSADSDLTEEGRMGAAIAGQKNKNLDIQIVITSPLSRAQETAKLFLEGAEISSVALKVNPYLTERNFGTLEGAPWSFELSRSLINDDLPDGVESWKELEKRATLLAEYLKTLDQDTVLLVGHGSIGRALRKILLPDVNVDEAIPNTELLRWL